MNTQVGAAGGTPTGANTVVLLNTFTALGVFLAVAGVSRLEFSVKNDQAGTLRLFKSNDGTTWDQTEGDVAVAIPAAGDVSGPYDFLVENYPYIRLDWINGGVSQTVWRPALTLVSERSAAV
jgi:hypothetical protein